MRLAREHRAFASWIYSAGFALLGLSLPLSLVAVEAVCGLLLLILLVRFTTGERLPISRWDLPLLLFLLVRFGTGIFSPYPQTVLKGLTYLLFCPVYVLTAWDPEGNREANFKQFVRGLVLGGAVASVVGVWQVLAGAQRAIGFYGGWTIFGSLTGAALVLGIYFTAGRGLFKRPALDVPLLILNAAGLAVSSCRTEWIAAALVLLPVGILMYPRLSLSLGTVAVGLLLAIAPLRGRLLTLGDPTSNLSGRDIIWQPALELIGERPIFGHGLNSFHQAFPAALKPLLTDPGAGDWHNTYLQVAIESGLVGLLVFLGMLWSGFYLARLNLLRAWTRADKARAWGLIALLAFFCLAGGLGTFLVRIPVIVLFFLVLGVVSRRNQAYRQLAGIS